MKIWGNNMFNKRLGIAFVVACLLSIKPIALQLPWFTWIPVFFFSAYFADIAIFFLCATQFLASPPDCPFTLTQLFIICFAIAYLPRMDKLYNVKRINVWLPPFFLFLVWLSVKSLVSVEISVIAPYFLLLVTLFIFNHVLTTTEEIKSVVGSLILGCFISATPFWLNKIGIDFLSGVRLSTEEAFRGGMMRFAAGTGDYNFIASGISICIATIYVYVLNYRRHVTLEYSICILIFGLSVPSLLATMSRGAVLSTSILCVSYSLFVLHNKFVSNEFRMTKKFINRIIFMFFLGGTIFIATFPYMKEYINGLVVFQEHREESLGLLDNRADKFGFAIGEIETRPILGPDPVKEFSSHNTFLAVGMRSGIVGLLIFIWLISKPFWSIKKIFNNLETRSLLMAYFSCLFAMLTLANEDFKVFWFIWIALLFLSYEKTRNISRHGFGYVR
jgi:hypothetical protein